MAQKPAAPRSAAPRRPRGTTAVGDWRDVAVALDTLGDTIARATAAAVKNEEIRTRLRDLAEGLAALSLRVSASLGELSGSRDLDSQPLARPYAPAPAQSDRFRPQVLNAVSAANEKFRQAAEDWDSPTEAMQPVAPVRAPIVAGAVAPIVAGSVAPVASFAAPAAPAAPAAAAAFAAAPTVEMPAVSSRPPARQAAAAGLSPDRLAAVRAASQRFAAERSESDQSAAVAIEPQPQVARAPDGIDSWLASAPDQPEVFEPVIETPPARRAARKPKAVAVAPAPAQAATPEATPAPAATPRRAARKPKEPAAAKAAPKASPKPAAAKTTPKPETPAAAPKTRSRGKAGPAKAGE